MVELIKSLIISYSILAVGCGADHQANLSDVRATSLCSLTGGNDHVTIDALAVAPDFETLLLVDPLCPLDRSRVPIFDPKLAASEVGRLTLDAHAERRFGRAIRVTLHGQARDESGERYFVVEQMTRRGTTGFTIPQETPPEPQIPARTRITSAAPAQLPTICDIAREPARYDGQTVEVDVTFASATLDNSHVETRGCGRALGLEVDTIATRPDDGTSLFWELVRAYRQSTPERWYGVFARARMRIRRAQKQIFVLDVEDISGPRLVPVPISNPPPPAPPLPPRERGSQRVAATFRQPPPSGCAPRSVRPERRRPPARVQPGCERQRRDADPKLR